MYKKDLLSFFDKLNRLKVIQAESQISAIITVYSHNSHNSHSFSSVSNVHATPSMSRRQISIIILIILPKI